MFNISILRQREFFEIYLFQGKQICVRPINNEKCLDMIKNTFLNKMIDQKNKNK